MSDSAQLHSYYDIVTFAPSLISDIANAKLTGIVSYDAASQGGLAMKHTSLYPYLPTGTSKSARELTYYKFLTTSGETVTLAKEWIASLTLVVSSNYRFEIRNITAEQLQSIKQQLLYMDISSYTVTRTT
jgi:hypothetical protein